MSFWDNVSLGLMTVCDNLRETKIGAKILDDIVDSIDRSEKRLERFEEQVDILFMEDVQTEGKKRGYVKDMHIMRRYPLGVTGMMQNTIRYSMEEPSLLAVSVVRQTLCQ